jgi:hypothetical protein
LAGVALQVFSPIFAVLFVVDWSRAPSMLTIEGARRLEVKAQLITPKRAEPYAYLLASDGMEVQVYCIKARQLCERLELGPSEQLEAWIVQPGMFYGTWLVAANERGRPVVRIEQQHPIYARHRAINASFALLATLIALFLWRTRWSAFFRRLALKSS